MKRIATLFVLIAVAAVLGACGHGWHRGPGGHGGPGCPKSQGCPKCANCPQGGPAAAEKAQQSPGTIYWCNCGPECKCNSVSAKPGKCSCGKEMAGGHVVFVEGNTALACTCGPECSCAIDPNDHTKCGCGKPVKKIDLKGTGLYFCNCGGSCACNSISDKPGSCGSCGMELHQAK
jgi:hypothetical protein